MHSFANGLHWHAIADLSKRAAKRHCLANWEHERYCFCLRISEPHHVPISDTLAGSVTFDRVGCPAFTISHGVADSDNQSNGVIY